MSPLQNLVNLVYGSSITVSYTQKNQNVLGVDMKYYKKLLTIKLSASGSLQERDFLIKDIKNVLNIGTSSQDTAK